MNRISVRKGDPIEATIEVRDLGGRSLVGIYNGTETVTSRLWAGDDRAEIDPALTVAWSNAAQGLIDLDYAGTDTAALDRGTYTAEVLVDGVLVWSGTLEVLAGPGDAVAPATYGTYDGMLLRGGTWVTGLNDPASQGGFVEERASARVWTDRLILARARMLLQIRERGYFGSSDARGLIEATADLSEPATIEDRLAWLAGVLDDGGLDAATTIREANEHYACWLVLSRVLSAREGAEQYQQHASRHYHRANALLNAETFRVRVYDDSEPPELVTTLTLGPV
jgi:hypothetical protein